LTRNSRNTDIRQLAFDGAFFSYTFALLLYFAIRFLATLSPDLPALDQDFMITHFTSLAWGAAALLGLGLLSSVALTSQRVSTVGAELFSNKSLESAATISFYKSFWGVHLITVFVLSLIVSIQITEASWIELLDTNGLQGALRLWSGLTNPNFAILARAVIVSLETIYIAFLATVIAVPLAFLIAFFCAKNIMVSPMAKPIYAALRLVLNITRSVEPLIWALIFTVWVGVGPFAGMLALLVHSVSSLTKYYSEILEGVADGPIDGVKSTGANAVQVVWHAIVPQIVLPYIGMTVYRWDTNVRMATVIGLVGGGGIGTLLIQYQGQAQWAEVGCIILVIAAVVWLLDLASAYIREALK